MNTGKGFTSAAFMALLAASVFAMNSFGNEAYRRVIVGYQSGQGPMATDATLRRGGAVVRTLDRHNALVAKLPEAAINGVKRNPHISYVEDDVRRYPMAEISPYGIAMVTANEPTLLQPESSSAKTICIIDSGYDEGHPDLPQGVARHTVDAGTGSSATDENGHGTHVAGTIAALAGNGTGVVGVNHSGGINLVIVKVFGADGWAYSSSLVAAHDICVANGADITNMSLGGDRKSRTEERAFAASPLLNIAAAGNDGNTRLSYPASYTAVLSVAAVDAQGAVADFSQQNSEVDIAAPGVSVLSTVPRGTGYLSSVSAGLAAVESTALAGSPNGTVSGTVVDCGLGTSTCEASGGAICLIQRGEIAFADKVQNCANGGGAAAVIYNNAPGLFSGTLGEVSVGIPAVGVTASAGATLLDQVGSPGQVVLEAGDYAHLDGTSMATPHVAGVAGLIWSQPGATNCTKDQIRSAMEATAIDLGPPGRDNATGHGLVQAAASVAYLGADCGASHYSF